MTNSALASSNHEASIFEAPELNKYRKISAQLAVATLIGTIILSTLAFGGAHRTTTLWATFSLSIAYVLALYGARRSSLSLSKSWIVTLARAALIWLLAWSILQPWLAGPVAVDHPIITGSIWFRDIESYLMAIRCIVLALLTAETVKLLSNRWLKIEQICFGLMLLGTSVAVIALVHWLYDNGKLFFIFSPDFVATQQRARWPFVNPNHLATFLLIPFGLGIASVISNWHEMVRLYQKKRRDRLEMFAGNRRAQRLAFRWGASLLASVLMAVALIASYSRANWMAAALLLIVLLYSPYARTNSTEAPQLKIVSKRSRSRRRPSFFQVYASKFRFAGKIAFGLFLAALVLFLLNDQGVELFQRRLEFGLLAAKDDIRWQLFRDSWKLFEAHPMLGIGLAAWHSSFSEVMNPLLSGLDAGYLHSDPLQLLLEIGVLGFFPFALFLLTPIFASLRTVWSARSGELILTRTLLIGILATLFASLGDFPFRMLAIQIQTVVCITLALLSAAQVVQTVDNRIG